jgi:hypothetical protein
MKLKAVRQKYFLTAHIITEVYFTGDYVFVSQIHGNAEAYTLNGRFVRMFGEIGYMSEAELLDGYIAAWYVSAPGERYSLILADDNLETLLYLPGFLGETDSGALILDDGAGNLHKRNLYTTDELIRMAKESLGGRTLTDDERVKYKAR